ncbi:MAG: hypothetical protein DHS20C18_14180 [Saprospiraceae bacterium]|nr:MAG: hypothetical protein DHS20C18_14180 [Saprospiraceae bacterium]
MENPFQKIIEQIIIILLNQGWPNEALRGALFLTLEMVGEQYPQPMLKSFWAQAPGHLQVKNLPKLEMLLGKHRALEKTFFREYFFEKRSLEVELPLRQIAGNNFRTLDDLLMIEPFTHSPELLAFPFDLEKITLIPIGLFHIPFAYMAIPFLLTREDSGIELWSHDLLFSFVVENWLMYSIDQQFKSNELTEENNELEIVQRYTRALADIFLPASYSIIQPDLPIRPIRFFNCKADKEDSFVITLGEQYRVSFQLKSIREEAQQQLFLLRRNLLADRIQQHFSRILLNWRILKTYSDGPPQNIQEAIKELRAQAELMDHIGQLVEKHKTTIQKVEKIIASANSDSISVLPENLFYYNGYNWVIFFEGEEVNYSGNPNAGFSILQFLLQNPDQGFEGNELREVLKDSGFAKTRQKKESKISPFEISELVASLEGKLSVDIEDMELENQFKVVSLIFDDLEILIKQIKASNIESYRRKLPRYYNLQNEYRKKMVNIKFDLDLDHDDSEFVSRVRHNTKLMAKPQGTTQEHKNLGDSIRNNLKNAIKSINTAPLKNHLEITIRISTRRPFKYETIKATPVDWHFLPPS